MKHLPLLLALGIPLGMQTSCLDEDYTTSAADAVTFSRDTVAFDTIISGIPTGTYQLTAYNRSDKALRIARVGLGLGAESPFKVVVDGTSLTAGEAGGFEIGARDSLIVFLMANTPATDNDEPVAVTDKLTFLTEAGASSEVVLTASGQAVTTLTGRRITADTTLGGRRPYRVTDSLVVAPGATLTLAAGTRFYFSPKAQLIVHGTLHIAGSGPDDTQRVTLRGDRMGNMFAGQAYDRIPGQWGGVVFTGNSYDSTIDYADIHSSTSGVRVDSGDVSRSKLVIRNSMIHNTTLNGLSIRGAQVSVGNSQITNAGGDCVHIRGGRTQLVHCTLARFFVFSGGNGHALDFANYDGKVRLPLEELTVVNSIVTGYQDDELMGSQNPDYKTDAYAYAFSHCLLTTPEPSEANAALTNCIYDVENDLVDEEGKPIVRERNFLPLPDLKHLTFSFALNPRSRAVGTADATVTSATFPNDLLGTPRGTAPDMGCYQHITEEKATNTP